jgi:hypothetical protein
MKKEYQMLILAGIIIALVMVSGCNSSGGLAIPDIPRPNINIPITQAPMSLITPKPASTPTEIPTQNITATVTTVPTAASTYAFVFV